MAINSHFIPRIWLNNFCKLPSWKDAENKFSSSGINIPALDSLRGIAALLVVADHTNVFSHPAGGLYGVILFFCLSGYLLALPFAADHIPVTARGISGYLHRRLWRILPMYIVYCFIAWLFYEHTGVWLLRHLLFLQADFHLWTIRQELILYLLLPLLLIASTRFSNPFLKGSILIGLAIILGIGIKNNFAEITETQKYNRFLIAPFLEGMGLAYFMEGLRQRQLLTILKPAFSIVCMLLLILIPIFLYCFNRVYLVWDHTWLIGLDYICLIVVVQLLPNGYVYKLLHLMPLRSVGVVGYSYYLLHYPIRDALIALRYHPWEYFFIVAVLTYAVSCVTYSFIEKPGMRIGKHMAMRLNSKQM